MELACTCMMEPVASLVRGGQLGEPGPAQVDLLVHFCGRPAWAAVSNAVPSEIRDMAPPERLEAILWSEELRAFSPFGADRSQPMVCLSESPRDHLQWLLTRGWAPWGLLVSRQAVYDLGGGPVWYARPEQLALLDRRLHGWAVRFDAAPESRSDWLHEREWRIPADPDSPVVPLVPGTLEAILVGDPEWEPVREVDVDTGDLINVITGEFTDAGSPYAEPVYAREEKWPRLWCNLPRLYWDATTGQLHDIPLSATEGRRLRTR